MASPTLTDITLTKTYADLTVLDAADLNATFDPMATYLNDTLKDNLQQLARDAFGTTDYTFDSDGVAQYTNNLFDKQYGEDFYNGGDIAIGVAVDVAYAAVDAVNAAIAFTPEKAGRYRCDFYFVHRATSTATTLMDIDVSFRVTDGTTASYAVNSGARLAAAGAGSEIIIHPIYLSYTFNWATTVARTITLQKFVRTATAVSANVVAAAAATGEIWMSVEKV